MSCKKCVKIRDAVLLCNQCRADLELGRLVRAMPKNSFLRLDPFGDWTYDPDYEDADTKMTKGKTPEQALRALKGE